MVEQTYQEYLTGEPHLLSIRHGVGGTMFDLKSMTSQDMGMSFDQRQGKLTLAPRGAIRKVRRSSADATEKQDQDDDARLLSAMSQFTEHMAPEDRAQLLGGMMQAMSHHKQPK